MADLLIKGKKTRFLKIRNFFKLKKLEKLLKKNPVIFDKLDEENIEEVIKNPIYTDQRKDINGFDKDITADEVVNTVIDFYYSISSEMGNTIKNLYNTYKNKIFIEEPTDENGNLIDTKTKFSEGVTLNPKAPKKVKMPDGTEKDVVCDIELCQNYTTYYTVAHEFMHLIQRSLGNEDEKLAEVNTRFIEYLLGEYLVEKGIITQKDVDNHNIVNNCQNGTASKLNDILIITKFAKEHKLKQSRLLKKIGCIPENLSNRLDGIIESINGEEKNQPRNDLRFINGMVGANKLLEIYNKDKDSFKKVYGRIMSKKYQGKFDFDHFFEDIEKAIKSNGWKKIEWNNKIFYIRETDNLPTEEQQSRNIKTSQKTDVDENERKIRKITINNRGKVYKSRTTILMLNKKLELLGVSEVKLEDGEVQAMLSERDISEARTPTLMNLPPELEHLSDTLYKDYGGGNAIQTKEELRGKGLGKELMYFLISYLKHKKIEKLKVSGYATNKDGKKSEGFFLGTGAKKINDTTSVYENFEYILENLGQRIIKTDEKGNDLIIDDEVFEK